jgi:hypothetical protein
LWIKWNDVAEALEAVGDASASTVLALDRECGPADPEAGSASIRLVRRLAAGGVVLIAGHRHPSAAWREAVRRAGADRAVWVTEEPPARGTPPLDGAIELGDDVCPSLDARHAQRITLSVCGRHNGRMILARDQLARWCVVGGRGCPHRREHRDG